MLPPDPVALSSADLRAVDARALAEHGLAGLVLMENAGAGAARLVVAARAEWRARGPVAVCCGTGNNGGDGAVLARHLANSGVDVEVLYVAEPGALRGDARAQHDTFASLRLPLRHAPALAEVAATLARCDVLVDALLGTGAHSAPRGPLAEWIRALNARRARGAHTVALDLPSGLDADTGAAAEPTVAADLTATFAAPKLGFAAPAAARWLGRLALVDIGVPRALLRPGVARG